MKSAFLNKKGNQWKAANYRYKESRPNRDFHCCPGYWQLPYDRPRTMCAFWARVCWRRLCAIFRHSGSTSQRLWWWRGRHRGRKCSGCDHLRVQSLWNRARVRRCTVSGHWLRVFLTEISNASRINVKCKISLLEIDLRKFFDNMKVKNWVWEIEYLCEDIVKHNLRISKTLLNFLLIL